MEPKLPPNTNENNRRKTMMYTFGDLFVKSPVAFYSYLYDFPQGLQLPPLHEYTREHWTNPCHDKDT